MAEGQNERQHDTIFGRLDDYADRIKTLEVKLELKLEHMGEKHDDLKDSHDTHGKTISAHAKWILTIGASGVAIFFIAKELGLFSGFGN